MWRATAVDQFLAAYSCTRTIADHSGVQFGRSSTSFRPLWSQIAALHGRNIPVSLASGHGMAELVLEGYRATLSCAAATWSPLTAGAIYRGKGAGNAVAPYQIIDSYTRITGGPSAPCLADHAVGPADGRLAAVGGVVDASCRHQNACTWERQKGFEPRPVQLRVRTRVRTHAWWVVAPASSA